MTNAPPSNISARVLQLEAALQQARNRFEILAAKRSSPNATRAWKAVVLGLIREMGQAKLAATPA